MRSEQDTTQWLHTQDCRNGLIQVNPSNWLGVKMTAADYVSTSRNYAQLERRGLIRRWAEGAYGSQTTHIELTDAGRAVAEKLTYGFCDSPTPPKAHSGELSGEQDPTASLPNSAQSAPVPDGIDVVETEPENL